MKRVIVVSDSHGNKQAIDEIFRHQNFDYLFFLGDVVEDLGVYINDERVKVVRGNCDFFSNEKREGFFVVENCVIFYTHGDDYGVKYTTKKLYDRVKDCNVNLVLFGHNHKYSCDIIEDITFVNPGALSAVRGGQNSFAKVTISGTKISVEKCSF